MDTARTTFCQEQEPSLESVVSAARVQLTGTVFHLNCLCMTRVHVRKQNLCSRVYYLGLIVVISNSLYDAPGHCGQRRLANLLLNLNF